MWKDCRRTKWRSGWIVPKPPCAPTLPMRGRNSAGIWSGESGNTMSHPSEATLALYAGRDLGWFARRRTERHLAGCEHCQREVEAYQSLRSVLPDLSEVPDLHWNRMAAEMKANIRLGLAAGECVREPASERYPRLFGSRALVSYASIAA